MQRESKFLEFKAEMTNSFLKTVSAFSNFGNGKIVFGVADDGSVIGIENSKDFCLDLENKINDSVDPKPDFSITANNDKTVTLQVFEGDFKPYYYKGKTFRRSDTSTVECSRLETERLILEGRNLSYENLPSKNQQLAFYVLEDELKKNLQLENAGIDILKTLNLYSNQSGYNNAASLLADKNDFLSIDLAKFRDDSLDEIQDRLRIENKSILVAFNLADVFFTKYYQYEKIEGSKRTTVELLPRKAFREAVANALIHRTWDVNAAILVRMFKSRIEIVSPGGLVSGITIEDYLEGKISSLRNPIVANVFFRLGIIEMMGTGIKRIKNTYRDFPVKPDFDVTENTISVVLPVCDATESNVSVEESKIIESLKNRILSRSEIEELTGMNKSKVIRELNKLVEKNLVKKTGGSRDVKYSLK